MAPRFAALFVLTMSCAPAPTPKVVAQPRPVAKPTPEQPRGALWSFHSAAVAKGSLTIGNGTLRYGEAGRRWIERNDGSIEPAATVLPAPIAGVLREGDKFLFIDERGVVHETLDPLGPRVAERAAPPGTIAHVASGRAAFLAIDDRGVAHRSIDGGRTWAKVPLAVRAGEIVASLAADRRGHVLALFHPQRVLASTDDGATFAPLATPGIGGDHLFVDGDDRLWLAAYSRELIEDDLNAFAKLTDAPLGFEVSTPPALPESPASNERRVLAGAYAITLKGDNAGTVTVAPLAGGTSHTFALGTFASPPDVHIAGAGSTLVFDVYDHTTRATILVRSNDGGATHALISTFDDRRTHRMVVAPGVVALGEQCDQTYKSCDPARIKIGDADFQVPDLPAKTRFLASAFDAERGRLFVFAGSSSGYALYRVSVDSGAFSKLDVKLPSDSLLSMTTQKDGALSLVFERSEAPAVLLRVDPETSNATEIELPFATPSLDLAGERGLAFVGARALETRDGGVHWLDVGPAMEGTIRCAPAGCLVGSDLRVGWELDASPGAPLAKEDTAAPVPSSAQKLRCTATGAWKKVPGELPYTGNQALDNDVRYLAEPPPDLPRPGPVAIGVARASDAPKKVQLLGDDPKGVTVRRWSHATPAGYVSARYSFAPAQPGEKKYNPVDVALGWYSAATGKASSAKLTALPPFRVGSGGPSAVTAIVDGGLIFVPYSGDAPLHFITDAGKVQTMPRPPGLTDRVPPEHAFRDDKRIVLASLDETTAQLWETNDAGKSWHRATWTLGLDARLATDGKQPVLLLGRRGEYGREVRPVGLLPFDAVTADPPALIAFDEAKIAAAVPALTPCAKSAHRFEFRDPPAISIKVASKGSADLEISAQQTFVHVTREGVGCVAGIAGSATDDSDTTLAVAIAPHDLAHAWLLRGAADGPFEHEARAMTCVRE